MYRFFDKIIIRTPCFGHATEAELHNDLFDEALYLSSPSLYVQLRKLKSNEINSKKEATRLLISKFKYENRSRYRPTPFGLFAGISTCNWSTSDDLTLFQNTKFKLKRKSRLDMDISILLKDELLKLSEIRNLLKFTVNNSLYELGNEIRYIEYSYSANRRVHSISQVQNHQYLDKILKSLSKPLTIQEIIEAVGFQDVEDSELTVFLNELIDSQILVSELEPFLIGGDYFSFLIVRLEQLGRDSQTNDISEIAEQLKLIRNEVEFLDNNLVNSVAKYRSIYKKIQQHLPSIQEKNFIQVDLYKEYETINFSHKYKESVIETIKFLNKITSVQKNNNLEEFKRKFTNRYEEQAVPLLRVMDVENGIGYPIKENTGINDPIDDIRSYKPNQSIQINWTPLENALHKLYLKSVSENLKIIEVREDDFRGIDYSTDNLPTSMAVMFKVLGEGKIKLNSCGGSSAINILGRFSSSNEEISRIVTEIGDIEKSRWPYGEIAEISHLPQRRTGNLLARSKFRDHEIAYLASSIPSDENYIIHAKDLYVKIQNNRVLLINIKTGKEVVPRLGNAHNYYNDSLPLYAFLCDIQEQMFDKSHLGISWGNLSESYPFLPRMVFKNTVLLPARWIIQGSELNAVDCDKSDEAEILSWMKDLILKLGLPTRFRLKEGDNELLIDTNLALSVIMFLHEIRGRSRIIIEEDLFDYNSSSETYNNNLCSNECITILINDKPLPTSSLSYKSNTIKAPIKRNFFTGDEWLYFKMYVGAKHADSIISNEMYHTVNFLESNNYSCGGFFIKYSDPEPHIRWRVKLHDKLKCGDVITIVNERLARALNDEIIWDFQLGMYKREIERYGTNSIELIEHLFYNDSFFVMNVLHSTQGSLDPYTRWKTGILATFTMLKDFGLTNNEIQKFVDNHAEMFFKEHNGDKRLSLTLDRKYRKYRNEIDNLIINRNLENLDEIEKLLSIRTASNIPIILELKQLMDKNELEVPFLSLLSSVIHMNINRLFMGRNRSNEFAIYEILKRALKSIDARKVKKVSIAYSK